MVSASAFRSSRPTQRLQALESTSGRKGRGIRALLQEPHTSFPHCEATRNEMTRHLGESCTIGILLLYLCELCLPCGSGVSAKRSRIAFCTIGTRARRNQGPRGAPRQCRRCRHQKLLPHCCQAHLHPPSITIEKNVEGSFPQKAQLLHCGPSEFYRNAKIASFKVEWHTVH